MKDFSLLATEDFVKPNALLWSNIFYITTGLFIGLVCAVGGGIILREIFPKVVTKEIVLPNLVKQTSPLATQPYNLIGVLIIKDYEALTVRYKRAAVGNKEGFSDLKDGIAYRILHYHIYEDVGYGIVDYGDGKSFHLVWQTGTAKAPDKNPGTIRVNNRKIELALN